MANWEPEEGEILALASVAVRGAGWHSCSQATLEEIPCDIASRYRKPIEAMELDATISVDPIAAIAPPVQVLPVAIMKHEQSH